MICISFNDMHIILKKVAEFKVIFLEVDSNFLSLFFKYYFYFENFWKEK